MTKADRRRPGSRLTAGAFLFAIIMIACARAAGGEPQRRARASGSVDVIREEASGPIIVSFASNPLPPPVPSASSRPPDGVHTAVLRAIGETRLSAACFHWEKREDALLWIRGQMDERRRRGIPSRLILAGHGLGATEAAETARELLFRERDAEIVLLLTVDAVKTSRYGGAAYAAGNAVVNRLPGVNHSFTAYDAAPAPDGRRVRAHINYHQDKPVNFHGAAMPNAENHKIADWTGLLNHGNAADFVMPLLVADLRHAIERSAGRPGR